MRNETFSCSIVVSAPLGLCLHSTCAFRHPSRLLGASLLPHRSCPRARHSRAAGPSVPPPSTALAASSARQTHPLAQRRRCSVDCPCFSTHPRATDAPPIPRRFHCSGGVGVTAPDARNVTVRVGHPSGRSALLSTCTRAAGGYPNPTFPAQSRRRAVCRTLVGAKQRRSLPLPA